MKLQERELRDRVNSICIEVNWNREYDGESSYFGTQMDWNNTILTAINRCSANIHKSSYIGGADSIFVSPAVLGIFDDLEYFHSISIDENNLNGKVGVLSGRYDVYVDWSCLDLFSRQLLLEKNKQGYCSDLILVYNDRNKIGGLVKVI